jgi:hypothetical protein
MSDSHWPLTPFACGRAGTSKRRQRRYDRSVHAAFGTGHVAKTAWNLVPGRGAGMRPRRLPRLGRPRVTLLGHPHAGHPHAGRDRDVGELAIVVPALPNHATPTGISPGAPRLGLMGRPCPSMRRGSPRPKTAHHGHAGRVEVAALVQFQTGTWCITAPKVAALRGAVVR